MILDDYLTPEEATKRGYQALTVPYCLPVEQRMLEHTMDDMDRGRIDAALIRVAENQIEVWRKPARHLHPNSSNPAVRADLN